MRLQLPIILVLPSVSLLESDFLCQQRCHCVQIHDLKRRCAEKDQSVRPLEEQVQHLQEEQDRIQQELEEANRDR